MKQLFTYSLLVFCLATQAQKDDYLVTIKTPHGDMTVLLYEETPLHKANFLELARSGKYDSTIFHRVINRFMIQGGDIYRKAGNQNDEKRIPAEIVEGLFHRKGELAAARTGDNVNPNKESSSCQFYIVQGKVFSNEELTIDQNKLNRVFAELIQSGQLDSLREHLMELNSQQKFEEMNQLILNSKDLLEKLSGEKLSKDISPERLAAYTTVGGTPHLDGAYTVYGRVVEGLDVIDKIASVKTSRGDVPETPVHMTMTVTKVKRKDVTKKYGYVYPVVKK
jgi:peptidyl-prolyl cis-trans isomerase B (cyclophilin B)